MRKKIIGLVSPLMFPGVHPLVIIAVNAILYDPPYWLPEVHRVGRLPYLRCWSIISRAGHDEQVCKLAGQIVGGYPGSPVVPLESLLDTIRGTLGARIGERHEYLAEDVFLVLNSLRPEKGRKRKIKKHRVASYSA